MEHILQTYFGHVSAWILLLIVLVMAKVVRFYRTLSNGREVPSIAGLIIASMFLGSCSSAVHLFLLK